MPAIRAPGALAAALPLVGFFAGGAQAQNGLQVTFTDINSLHTAASTVAYNMMTYYIGNQTGQAPGMFPGSGTPTGYYWWEGSEAFDALMHYWYYFGDDSYNEVVTQALTWQAGDDRDFQPQNQTLDLGNDDQAYWGLAAMSAAELKFPNPPKDQPQWLPLAQAVFNKQQGRWDPNTCGGGLRWQFNPLNGGYTYKSTVAQSALMQLSARLGLFTGNQTYFDFAEKLYDWTKNVGLIAPDYTIYDGANVTDNCSQPNTQQFSNNPGCFVGGLAAMYNGTKLWGVGNPDKWHTELSSMLDHSLDEYFKDGIAFETICEPYGNCNHDMISYKSQVMQMFSDAAKLVPDQAPRILDKLMTSAKAAITVCNCGGVSGQCGFMWTTPGTCDGNYGLGQEINALNAIQIWAEMNKAGPANEKTGGDGLSQSDPNAGDSGTESVQEQEDQLHGPIKTADKAGAGILSILWVFIMVPGAAWMALS